MVGGLMEPTFLITAVPGEAAGAVFTAMGGAITALWRRAQVLQDRNDARSDANLKTITEIVERVSEALDDNTNAIREALRG